MGSNVKIIGISQISFVLLTISMFGGLSIVASLNENVQNRITKLQDTVEANPNPHSSDEATVMDTLKRLTRQSGFSQSDTDQLAYALEELIEKKLKSCTCTCPTTGPSERCGGPGWRNVAFIDMTNTSQNCPQGLTMTGYSKRSCGRTHTNEYDCSSVTFPVGGGQYSRVCGRAKAYTWGNLYSFYGYNSDSHGINAPYVDGLSFTHGTPRTHIWTFAAGLYQGTSGNTRSRIQRCPCNQGNTYGSPPFVGNDYFCESGVSALFALGRRLHPDDPLWDGQGCIDGNPCCSLNNPPWFSKTLPTPTTDDIEMRLCLENSATYSNIALEQMELYVY